MQKTISINIGNIIFHINEDCYETLKDYLDSINKYFSNYSDSDEIISDIEHRIAEKFLLRLNNNKQNINSQDVKDLMDDMGTLEDFKASMTDEDEEMQPENQSQEAYDEDETEDATNETRKRLFRDGQRKLIGGVSSGLAHYLGIDPMWIRLFFVLTIFNGAFFDIPKIGGFGLLAYIILWVSMPLNNALKENKKIKKLFRDTEHQVLGGVCSGIANYFDFDPTILRIICVVLIPLYGVVVLLYIALWMIVPMAKTITEKMQMKGNPVTLNNIESTIKKNLNLDEKEESNLTRLLLLPFRAVAAVLKTLGKLIVPLSKSMLDLVRVGIGILLIFIGITLIFSTTSVLVGYLSDSSFYTNFINFGNLSGREIIESIDPMSAICSYFVVSIPSFGLIIFGLFAITKKKRLNSGIGLGLIALWILSFLGTLFFLPNTIKSFRYSDEIENSKVYEVESDTLYLSLNENLTEKMIENVELTIKPHRDSANYTLKTIIYSKGKSKPIARKNASETMYDVDYDGMNMVFDEGFSVEKSGYRFQSIKNILYVPYGKVFQMDKNIKAILRNTLWKNNYKARDIDGNYWMFDKDGIQCVSCPKPIKQKQETANKTGNFSHIQVSSFIDFEIIQSDKYSIHVIDDEDEKVEITNNGKVLAITHEDDENWWKKTNQMGRVTVKINTPTIDKLTVGGNSLGKIEDFELDELKIEMNGASTLKINLDAEKLRVKQSGSTTLKISGKVSELEAKINGASSLESYDLKADEVEIEALGASNAKVYAKQKLWAKASGVSSVKYRGSPEVISNNANLGNVEAD